MVINHNISALNTLNQLSKNTKSAQSSLQKLSSGLRINSAADDAAGLAISQKMQAQINGLSQASSNAQDGISLVQTADGALSETQSILQRMNDLANQSANGTNTDTDRADIQSEVTQLKSEIDRISNTTQFNNMNVLDGSMGTQAVVNGADALKVTGANKNQVSLDASLKADNFAVAATAAGTVSAAVNSSSSGVTAADLTTTAATDISGLALGNYTMTLDSAGTADHFNVTVKDSSGNTVISAVNQDLSAASTTITDTTTPSTLITLTGAAGKYSAGTTTFSLSGKFAAAGKFTVTGATSGAVIYSNAANSTYNSANFDANGLNLNLTTDTFLNGGAATTTVDTTNSSVTMQIGANENQTMQIGIQQMSTKALGVDSIDLSTASGAQSALSTIQTAINTVSSQRATLGAYQNRLDHTINNLTTESQNLTSASSSITDVDMAAEMTNYTKNNILVQSAEAMLAQANQLPQGVLSLLK